MTSRERILRALHHKEADRVALADAPWGTTIRRWHEEGLPKKMGPGEYFGYEFAGHGPDTSFQFPSETVEETDEYTIVRNSQGAVAKNWKHKTSTPEYVEFTIKDRKTWLEHKRRLAWNDSRVDWKNGLKSNKEVRRQGYFVTFGGAFGYDKTQGIVGSQNLLMAMIEDPGWVKDMFETASRMLVEGLEEMTARGFVFDGAFVYDDMGYRNASLFSPRHYRELLLGAHKMFCDCAHAKRLKVILHSCGRVRELAPHLVEAGFDCLQPLEVKAGMDLIELKRKFGERLAFMGGIDVRAMADADPRAIEQEIATKIPYAKYGGGYIYHSDHSVPDNVSFKNYCHTIELVHYYGTFGSYPRISFSPSAVRTRLRKSRGEEAAKKPARTKRGKTAPDRRARKPAAKKRASR